MNKEQIESRLIEGNNRYIEDKEDLKSDALLRQKLTDGQHPFAIVLSCADSRVVPEMIFDCNIGELFVVRVAGNIANSSSIASIEYAVANIGCELIVVLGHESCGAVTATIKGGDNGKNLNHLCSFISPSIELAEDDQVNSVVKANAKYNAELLVKNSEIISGFVSSGKLKIQPAYYSLAKGKVDFL
jgi:carbonic anhydrase